jgi:hypothetical protein
MYPHVLVVGPIKHDVSRVSTDCEILIRWRDRLYVDERIDIGC